MSIGSVGGTSSLFSSGGKSGPGNEDGTPLGGGAGESLGNAEPTSTPRPTIHPHSNIELDGAPQLDQKPRLHFHPTPVIEPRPVFHYDADAQDTGSKHHAHASLEDLPKSEIDPRNARIARTYDRRARDVVMVGSKPMIDLFV